MSGNRTAMIIRVRIEGIKGGGKAKGGGSKKGGKREHFEEKTGKKRVTVTSRERESYLL